MPNHRPSAAELASAILTHPNLRPSEIAATHGATRHHVSAVGARLGIKHRAGRPPTNALTPRSARSRRLVAALAVVAEASATTPEAVLLNLATDAALAARLKAILEVDALDAPSPAPTDRIASLETKAVRR